MSTEQTEPTQLDPLSALRFLSDSIKANPQMLGHDGAPIHWMVKDVDHGLLICDSAFLMAGVNYSGIQFNIRGPLREVDADQMEPMFKTILDYLESVVPESKEWAVEFKGDTPMIPTNRTVLDD